MSSTLVTEQPRKVQVVDVVKRGLRNQRILLVVLIVVIAAIFATTNSNFLNSRFVIFPLLRDASIVMIVGLAQMCALSIGHMNIAVGRMAAMGAMAAGFSYQYLGLPLIAGLLIGMMVGALLGALAGTIIVRSGVNSFVVTLALDFALLGLVTLIYKSMSGEAAAFTTKPAGMDFLRNTSFAQVCLGDFCGPQAIPVMLIPALAVAAVMHFVYARMRIGRELIATGANRAAAELSGIDSNRRILQAHIMSGTLAALAGVLLGFASGSFTAAIGSEFMLPSFLAPVLGGTLMAGGFVSVIGTFLGALLSGVIRVGLSVQGLGLDLLNIALGTVLLVALATERLRTAR